MGQNVTQKQVKKQELPKPLTERELEMYIGGWNMALQTACDVLMDIMSLRGGENDGMGVS